MENSNVEQEEFQSEDSNIINEYEKETNCNFLLTEIHRCNSKQKGNIVTVGDWDSVYNYADKVVLCNRSLNEIKNLKIKKLTVLKLTSLDTGKSIYRELCYYGMTNVKTGIAAVTYQSRWELGLKEKKLYYPIEIKQSWWWKFYWNHPVHATRISFQVGVVAIIISLIVSVLCGIFSNYLQMIPGVFANMF